MHMVNLVEGQSIVQHASENGWRHLRLGLYKVRRRKNIPFLGAKAKAASPQLSEITFTDAPNTSNKALLHTVVLLCPRNKEGSDFNNCF